MHEQNLLKIWIWKPKFLFFKSCLVIEISNLNFIRKEELSFQQILLLLQVLKQILHGLLTTIKQESLLLKGIDSYLMVKEFLFYPLMNILKYWLELNKSWVMEHLGLLPTYGIGRS